MSVKSFFNRRLGLQAIPNGGAHPGRHRLPQACGKRIYYIENYTPNQEKKDMPHRQACPFCALLITSVISEKKREQFPRRAGSTLSISLAQCRLPDAMTRTVFCFKDPEIGIIFSRLGYFSVRKLHRKGHLYSYRPGTIFILISPFQDYQGRCYFKGFTLQDPGIVYCLENFSVRRSREFGTTGCAHY